MKRIYILILILLAIQINGFGQKNRNKIIVKSDTVAVDTSKYELIIIDPGFESWLATRPPMTYYTKEYYESKNRFYVVEWNYRYEHSTRYGDMYESRVDYYPNIDYGIELNYKLYNYFVYFEEKHHVKLIGGRELIN